MAIVVQSGFLAMVNSVRTDLAARGINANVEVGWKRRYRQDNQGAGGANRVVFVPSEPGGAGGSMIGSKLTGDRNVPDANGIVIGTIRALRDWQRKAFVSVWAKSTVSGDEAGDIEAVETLLEAVMGAMHGAQGSFASLDFGDVTWTSPGERNYGLEAVLGFTFRHPMFLVPRDVVYPTAVAVSRGSFPDPAPATGGDT